MGGRAVKRIVVAGTGSGVGKTTITLGLMSAFKQKGYVVQGFKCGPDYIDPTYHTAVTGRRSRNLDSWMGNEDIVRYVCKKGSEGAHLSIIEGVMGLFDGKRATTDEGSTAEISIITESPVLLVVDCSGMARSAAAVVRGFQLFHKDVRIVGVIANRVGSEGHFRLVKEAIEQQCGIPVVGYLQKTNDLTIPERHLGLVPSVERGELQPFFDRLGERITQTFDLDMIWELAEATELQSKPLFTLKQTYDVRIAVAKDAAFHFYYEENLEMLQAYGAELVYFSPLAGECVPHDVHGLYIGGGFPEEFAAELAQHEQVKQSVAEAIQRGLPTLAECGGFMYLTEGIETTDGQYYEMVGVIPGHVRMQRALVALGYREMTGMAGNFLFEQDKAKGHEFHYSTFIRRQEEKFAYEAKGLRGCKRDGYMDKRLVAGYVHFYFLSNPLLVERWLKACSEVKKDA
ncbi:cobyrinic acid a,c-diamide synthase [Anoxybacillus flavithermus NBRC 109594]|uniref:Cobyrinate a,c-diamide synthase n=1 Tax=Anoxybacillus flavithermus NBRC 109594 TaxID=1315967 RepID=R4FZW5_9BACL|nr:cobyrinate a,c-diamide synthase [Anoxybacillus flavithermus]MCX8047732.1 cobyrinate a,c-diamide synthase [Anoxybacillus gonensis]GAC90154.1 cobyrinic acid a,c-diamide synthase [Anoxybacillus flavithermus NBRC 109594]